MSASRRDTEAHLFALQYQLIFDRAEGVAAPSGPVAATAESTARRRRLVRVAASFLEQVHYDAVVEERSVNRVCGYPLCAQPLNARAATPKYRLAPRDGKVYSAAASARFCSESCVVASAFFAKQLSAVSVHVRDHARPLPVRFIDDDARVDPWLRDGPALKALFARLRHRRPDAPAPAPAAPAAAADPPPVVLADVVREVPLARQAAAPAPPIGSQPLAIDGYTPKAARQTLARIRGADDDLDDDDDDDDGDGDDDGVDVAALKRFLETGDNAAAVEPPAVADAKTSELTDGELLAAFGRPVPRKLFATENYSDFVQLWLLFDLWRPDRALVDGAAVPTRQLAQVDDDDDVDVDDGGVAVGGGGGEPLESDLMLSDVDTSQSGLRQKALLTMLRTALRELERVCAKTAPLCDATRRDAHALLAEASHTAQLRGAVPPLGAHAQAWLALLLLEARGGLWPGARAAFVNDGGGGVDSARHEALLARAVDLTREV